MNNTADQFEKRRKGNKTILNRENLCWFENNGQMHFWIMPLDWHLQ